MKSEEGMCTEETSTSDAKLGSLAHVKLGDMNNQLQFQEFVQGSLLKKEHISEEKREILMELNSGGEDDEMTSEPVKFEPTIDLVPEIKEESGQTYSFIRKRKLDFHKSCTENLEEDILPDRVSSTSYHDTNKRKLDFSMSFTDNFEEDQSTDKSSKYDTNRDLDTKEFTFVSTTCRIDPGYNTKDFNNENQYCTNRLTLDPSYFRIITSNEENETIVPDLIEREDTIYGEDSSCPEHVKGSGWKEIYLTNISEPKSSYISHTEIDKVCSDATHSNIGHHNNCSMNNLTLQNCVSSNNSIQPNTRNQDGQEINKPTNTVLPKNLTVVEKCNFQRLSTCTVPVQNPMSSLNPKSALTRRVVSKLNPEVDNVLSQSQRGNATITPSTPAGFKQKRSRTKLRQILPKDVSSVQSSNPKPNVQGTTSLNQNNPSMNVTLTAETIQNNSFTQSLFSENVSAKESLTSGQNANSVLNVIRNAQVAQNAMFTNSMSSTKPSTLLQNVSPNLSLNLVGYIIPSQPQLPTGTNHVFNTPGFIVLPQRTLPCNEAPMLKTVLSTNQTTPASAVSTVTNTLSTGQRPLPVSTCTVPMLKNVLTTKMVMNPVELNKQNNRPSKQPPNNSSVKNLRNVRSLRISDHPRSKLPATKGCGETSGQQSANFVQSKMFSARSTVSNALKQASVSNKSTSNRVRNQPSTSDINETYPTGSQIDEDTPLVKIASLPNKIIAAERVNIPKVKSVPSEIPLTLLRKAILSDDIGSEIPSTLQNNETCELSNQKYLAETTSPKQKEFTPITLPQGCSKIPPNQIENNRPFEKRMAPNTRNTLSKRSSLNETPITFLGNNTPQTHLQTGINSKLDNDHTITIYDSEEDSSDERAQQKKPFDEDIQIVCSKKSSSFPDMNSGESDLENVQPQLYKCAVCNAVYNRVDSCLLHYKQVHLQVKVS